MARYGCYINALCDLYNLLDADFKFVIDETMESNGNASSLLRLLKVWEGDKVNIFNGVISEALGFFVMIDETTSCYVFRFDDVRLNITLEDVLYLTGLPIVDNPVITYDNHNVNAFKEVFDVDDSLNIKMPVLFDIVKDKSRTTEKRIIAILLAIIECFVMPLGNGYVAHSCCIPVIKNLEEINSYSWGAALLACLYNGMIKKRLGDKTIMDGFLLLRICGLQSALAVEVNVEPPKLLLTSVIEACKPICYDKKSHKKKVEAVFANISNHEITWRSYARHMLRDERNNQLQYVTLVSPLFCMNKVVNHAPYLVPKKFQLHRMNYVYELRNILQKIVRKNSGDKPMPLTRHYKRELEL